MFVYLDREQIFFFYFYLVYQREVAFFLAMIKSVSVCVCVSVCLQRAEETVEEARVQDPINQQIG